MGCDPSWLVEFVRVDGWDDIPALTRALGVVLMEPEWAKGTTFLLSKWLGGPVKLISEEEYAE